ncbi:ATP-binding protein [Sulfitobacter sp. HNIBRBA3233]|uniref:PAS domain-containing sensor histidine kinase n=1 Tax=Sulfitobacter marinivivus TaxID=3158558 RepID=UPI0032DEDAF9
MAKTFDSFLRRVMPRFIGARRPATREADSHGLSLLDPHMLAVNAHAMVSLLDPEGRIEQVNDRFMEAFGYTEDEIVGQRGRIIYANTESLTFEDVQASMKQGKYWTGEQFLKRKDGTQFWAQATIYPLFDSNGKHIRSMTLRTDITEAKMMRSELEMYAALDLFEDSMFMFTTDTLRFTYMNRAALKRWGWSGDEFISKTPSCGNSRFDEAKFRKRAAPLLNGEVSEVVYRSDLYDAPYEVTLRLTTTAQGEKRFVTVERNVADQIALEETRNAFTATVSHELRSPLTSIKGGLGLVLSGAAGEMPEKARGLLEIAHRNADRLVLIVNDMLDLEKMAAGQMSLDKRPVDAVDLVDEALRASQGYFDNYGVSVVAEGMHHDVTLLCDPDRILQVLANLLSNAAKFSDEGGKIRVALSLEEGHAKITVQDFGSGIPLDAQKTIFERFTQAQSADRSRTGGTGLGLSIVKAIVELHDGHVRLDSTEGKGTSFDVVLPHETAEQRAMIGAYPPTQPRCRAGHPT